MSFIIGSLVIDQPAILEALTPFVTIFARMSPQQKGDTIRATKANGTYCLMCGDGTNDVAALKQSHVGVSILSNVEIEDFVADREAQLHEQAEKDDWDRLVVNEQYERFVERTQNPALQVRTPLDPFFLDGLSHCRRTKNAHSLSFRFQTVGSLFALCPFSSSQCILWFDMISRHGGLARPTHARSQRERAAEARRREHRLSLHLQVHRHRQR